MKAVKRFDPDRGVRLVSFAIHWIKAEMHEYILRNWRLVKVATTKAQRKLFFNLRSMKKGLAPLTRAAVSRVARELRLTLLGEHGNGVHGLDVGFEARDRRKGRQGHGVHGSVVLLADYFSTHRIGVLRR